MSGQEPTTQTPPAPGGQNPPAGPTPPAQPPATPPAAPPASPDQTMVDINAVGADGKRLYFTADYVDDLRKEAENYRKKVRELEANATPPAPGGQNPPAGPTPPVEPDPALKRVEALEAQILERDINTAILAAAAKVEGERGRFIDPSDAVRLIDRSQIKIDNGSVTGVSEALTALATNKPHLIEKKAAPNTGASNPAGGGQPGSTIVDRIKRQYGQQGSGNPFSGGGVVMPENLEK